VDGGAGQVSTTIKVLNEFNLSIPVAGMVKDDRHRTRGIYFRGETFELKSRKTLWRFVTAIQDEVHRFAVDFHRQRRSKTLIKSELENILGVGEKTRRKLLDHFKGVQGLESATVDEMMKVDGIGEKQAEIIRNYFIENANTEKEGEA